MGRHSIRVKFTLLLTAIIVSLIVLVVFINNAFSEQFYFDGKRKLMLSNYDCINDILNNYSAGDITDNQMNDSLEQLTNSTAMSVIVVNSDWTTVYVSSNVEDEMINRLRMSIFNNDIFQQDSQQQPSQDSSAQPAPDGKNKGGKNGIDKNRPSDMNMDDMAGDNNNSSTDTDNTDSDISSDNLKDPYMINMSGSGIGETREIILKTDKYTLQKIYDTRLGDYYYELWGTLDCGDSIMLRLAIQGIKDNVTIFNKFITYIGIAITLIGIVVAYIFSSYFTKPIMQLSELAKKMAAMDFDARYEGNDKGEIGILGESMNYMSSRLEQNIAQLKSANLELQRDIDKKVKIDQMRTEFLSNVSHELKTPIALIQGYAEGLKEGITDDPESMDFYCSVIMDEANKMNMMVKKLLTLNQIEFGDEELVMERFDIIELVSSVVNANELRAGQKGIKIIFNQADEHIDVWSDEYKIEEVITNYISNAINHCDFEKRIEVNVKKNGDNIRVSVFNTGKNIPEEDINNIWGKFYKVDKARTREYGGNGIGLSIVKAIMDSYGKEYGVRNLDNGVEFWFDLDAKSVV